MGHLHYVSVMVMLDKKNVHSEWSLLSFYSKQQLQNSKHFSVKINRIKKPEERDSFRVSQIQLGCSGE